MGEPIMGKQEIYTKVDPDNGDDIYYTIDPDTGDDIPTTPKGTAIKVNKQPNAPGPDVVKALYEATAKPVGNVLAQAGSGGLNAAYYGLENLGVNAPVLRTAANNLDPYKGMDDIQRYFSLGRDLISTGSLAIGQPELGVAGKVGVNLATGAVLNPIIETVASKLPPIPEITTHNQVLDESLKTLVVAAPAILAHSPNLAKFTGNNRVSISPMPLSRAEAIEQAIKYPNLSQDPLHMDKLTSDNITNPRTKLVLDDLNKLSEIKTKYPEAYNAYKQKQFDWLDKETSNRLNLSKGVGELRKKDFKYWNDMDTDIKEGVNALKSRGIHTPDDLKEIMLTNRPNDNDFKNALTLYIYNPKEYEAAFTRSRKSLIEQQEAKNAIYGAAYKPGMEFNPKGLKSIIGKKGYIDSKGIMTQPIPVEQQVLPAYRVPLEKKFVQSTELPESIPYKNALELAADRAKVASTSPLSLKQLNPISIAANIASSPWTKGLAPVIHDINSYNAFNRLMSKDFLASYGKNIIGAGTPILNNFVNSENK